MNIHCYEQSGREVYIISGPGGRYDVGIYGQAATRSDAVAAATAEPAASVSRTPRRWNQAPPEPNAVTTRLCLFTLRGIPFSGIAGFLREHGLFLPVAVEDALWLQDVQLQSRPASSDDPRAALTNWGRQTDEP